MGHSAAFGIDVETKFAFRVFSTEVNFACWSFNTLCSDDKVVDEFLHAGKNLVLGRKHVFGVGYIDWAAREVGKNLADDADRLSHFLHTDKVAIVGVAVFSDGNIKVVILVA